VCSVAASRTAAPAKNGSASSGRARNSSAAAVRRRVAARRLRTRAVTLCALGAAAAACVALLAFAPEMLLYPARELYIVLTTPIGAAAAVAAAFGLAWRTTFDEA
jgi:fatty acid desaturase